jgi:hypothetical protein
MTQPHRAPDGGLCYVIKGSKHGVVRTFDTVAWEATAPTCPTPNTPGHYACFACHRTGIPGTAYDAHRHAATCRPPE